MHAHWDGGEVVNDVTPCIDEAVPSGHVVHDPQLIGQVVPADTAASEHDGANSLRPQEWDVQTMVDAKA